MLCAFIFAFIGCATTPIENQFSARWEKTKAGMALEEFKQVWHEAEYKGEGKENNGLVTEVYVFTFQPYKYSMAAFEAFAFQSNKLVYWSDGQKFTDGKTVLTKQDVKNGKTS